MKRLLEGIKFGLLLQFAVGPICLFIFNEANNKGFLSAQSAVISVVIVDFLFVFLAIMGITSIFNSKKRIKQLKLFGSFILFLFGINIILNTINVNLIPQFSKSYSYSNSFLTGLILTGSNPLTILFWSGIFSIKLNNAKYKKYEVYQFGFGAVFATLIFLTIIAIMGTITSNYVPEKIIKMFNLIVGIVFIIFSIKLFINKKQI